MSAEAAQAAAKVWPIPNTRDIAAVDRVVREVAIETSGNDDPASLYAAALNLLWQASRCASAGYGRFDPTVTSVPRIRPEPL